MYPRVTQWSNRRINEALARVEREDSELAVRMINEGRGWEPWSVTSQQLDSLSLAMRRNAERRHYLRCEIERRIGTYATRLPEGRF